MTRVRVRHLVTINGNAFWKPTPKMRAAGFAARPLGPVGPAAWAKAEALNAEWDAWRRSRVAAEPVIVPGSLADVFRRYQVLGEWTRKAPRTKEEWDYVWSILKVPFGSVPVRDITAEDCDHFYRLMAEKKHWSLHKRHKVIKAFRALMEAAIRMSLIASNPTLIVRNSAPAGRSAIWQPDEVQRLIATACNAGYQGLGLAIAIAYDSQLSPVDVRGLTLVKRARDAQGTYFAIRRKKTGKAAFATLTGPTEALLDQYLSALGVALAPDAPIIRHRSKRPYTKDRLVKDFATIREKAFPGDSRRLKDLRRTGNVEAALGGARPQDLSAKAGSTIGTSNKLFETYTPVQLEAVRQADGARDAFRRRRNKNGT